MHETPPPTVNINIGDTVDVYAQTGTYPGVVTWLQPPNVSELRPDNTLALPGTIGETPVVVTGHMEVDTLAAKMAEAGSDIDLVKDRLLGQVAVGPVAQPTLSEEDLELLDYEITDFEEPEE